MDEKECRDNALAAARRIHEVVDDVLEEILLGYIPDVVDTDRMLESADDLNKAIGKWWFASDIAKRGTNV